MDNARTQQAIQFIKENKKIIINRFANLDIYKSVESPFTIFMAGSPGAGKTEFSTSFDPSMFQYVSSVPIVRIDADEIRKLIPQFTGDNSDEVQPAATIGVEKLFDYVQKHSQNAIVDTTFSDYHKAYNNVKRALTRGRKVGIFYIHLDPDIAWAYTKIREVKEGRSVTKEFFIDSYFSAKENVSKIKEELGNKIEINLITKHIGENTIKAETEFNIEKIENYIKIKYNKEELIKLLV